MSERERLLIIGGDAAGMSAAAQARRRAPAEKLEIVAFEKGDFTSYGACGLPYYVAGRIDDPEELVSRSAEQHRAKTVDNSPSHVLASSTKALHPLPQRNNAFARGNCSCQISID